MPSRRLSARLALSLVSACLALPPLQSRAQKSKRASPGTSLQQGKGGAIQTNWVGKDKKLNINKQLEGGVEVGKRTLMGISFILLFFWGGAKLFHSADPSGHKLGEGRRSGRKLTARAPRLSPRLCLMLVPSTSSSPPLAVFLNVICPFIPVITIPAFKTQAIEKHRDNW